MGTYIKHLPKELKVSAKSLDEAYKLGYFSTRIGRDELIDRIIKHNDQLHVYGGMVNGELRAGIWDITKNRFVYGISKALFNIPEFTIQQVSDDEMDGYVLARGWRSVIRGVMKLGYKVDIGGLLT